MLTEASIRRVLYYPEQLPDGVVFATIAGVSEASPAILDTRQFPPLLLRLSEVAADRDDDVEMRFRVDNDSFSALTGSMFNLLANNFSLLAKSKLYYNLFNSAVGAKANFKSFYSLWVIKPTVAHKLRYGITLTPEEEKLNRDLGIADTVEKGLLPLPLAEQISREYQIIREETHGFQVTVPTAGVNIESIYPNPGEFLVLTKISADPGVAATDGILVTIDRDYISGYIQYPTWALGVIDTTCLGKEISCFIPAISELRVNLNATVSRVINIRYTFLRCAMTNIFRARWGLVSPDELPGDVYRKVLAGVL